MALSNMLWASIAALMLVLAATACTAQNLGEAVQEAADRAREGALAAGATDAVADQLARSTGESFQNLLIQEGQNADQFTCLADLINAGVDQAAIRCATSIQIIAAGTGIVNGCPDGCGVFYDVLDKDCKNRVTDGEAGGEFRTVFDACGIDYDSKGTSEDATTEGDAQSGSSPNAAPTSDATPMAAGIASFLMAATAVLILMQ